jgi:hypothetical protein
MRAMMAESVARQIVRRQGSLPPSLDLPSSEKNRRRRIFHRYFACNGEAFSAYQTDVNNQTKETEMPFDTAILGSDFVPMNHKAVQPISARALKIFDEDGKEIEGFHHIVRGDTGATLRVAPASYTVVQNEEAIDAIESALKKSKLDLTDARFGADYSDNGARMFAQWILPAHTAHIRDDVEASLRVILLNSYDSSCALQGRVGSFNWACANQAVSGKEYASFRLQHSGKIDLVPAIGKLTLAAEEHVVEVKRWEKWPAVAVSDILARKVISALPKASGMLVDNLVHAWLKARDEDPLQGGPNLFCLWNVLTAWSSKERDGENPATRNWERQNRVAELVESKLWAEVEAAGA